MELRRTLGHYRTIHSVKLKYHVKIGNAQAFELTDDGAKNWQQKGASMYSTLMSVVLLFFRVRLRNRQGSAHAPVARTVLNYPPIRHPGLTFSTQPTHYPKIFTAAEALTSHRMGMPHTRVHKLLFPPLSSRPKTCSEPINEWCVRIVLCL